MLTWIGIDRNWQDTKKGMEDMYSPIATEVHAASELHKKWTDETLQEYIQNYKDLTEKAMGVHPGNVHNLVTILIILLFIKNVYNKDIRQYVAGAKAINILADAFKLAHQSLMKLAKYEDLIYNDECKVAEINLLWTHPKTQTGVRVLNLR